MKDFILKYKMFLLILIITIICIIPIVVLFLPIPRLKDLILNDYLNDLSLSEIAENYGVSRNAVHKNIKEISSFSCLTSALNNFSAPVLTPTLFSLLTRPIIFFTSSKFPSLKYGKFTTSPLYSNFNLSKE